MNPNKEGRRVLHSLAELGNLSALSQVEDSSSFSLKQAHNRAKIVPMKTPEVINGLEESHFELLPNSYKEMLQAYSFLASRLAPFISYISSRYNFAPSSASEKRFIGELNWDVRKKGSNAHPAMSFYREEMDGENPSKLIQVEARIDSGRKKLERVEYAETSIDGKTGAKRLVFTIVNFDHGISRVSQDITGNNMEDQHLDIDFHSHTIARLERQGISLVTITPGEEKISAALLGGDMVTNSKTGIRQIAREDGSIIYLPPTDLLLAQMIRQALNFEAVSLEKNSVHKA